MNRILKSLTAALTLALLAAGCSAATSSEGDEQGSLGSDEATLTADQCDYFDVNGMVQICHGLGNGKYRILRLAEQACVNAHSAHAGDYVTSTDPSSPLYDPTCQGLGCLPEAAPCDATLPCCDGLTCKDGTCQSAAPSCPCADQYPDEWVWSVQHTIDTWWAECYFPEGGIIVDADPLFTFTTSDGACSVMDPVSGYSHEITGITDEQKQACNDLILPLCL